MCSTPFGIRDSTHLEMLVGQKLGKVLNAFRHQRFDTDTFRLVLILFYCAQRLSASEIRHVSDGMSIGCLMRVLNAFRHQRFDTFYSLNQLHQLTLCSTPFGIRDSTLGLARKGLRLVACSTPFGIRDSTPILNWHCKQSTHCAQRLSASEIRHSQPYCRVKPTSVVLNAFRHQRFDTKALANPSESIGSAQRLSASEIRHN